MGCLNSKEKPAPNGGTTPNGGSDASTQQEAKPKTAKKEPANKVDEPEGDDNKLDADCT